MGIQGSEPANLTKGFDIKNVNKKRVFRLIVPGLHSIVLLKSVLNWRFAIAGDKILSLIQWFSFVKDEKFPSSKYR